MKKMWLMSLAVLCVMAACNKEENLQPGSELPPDSITQISESEPAADRSTCDPLDGVVLDGDMLSFESNEHVEQVLECLEQAYENHQDAFEAQYGDLSDDEMELIEEEIGFDDYLPLRDFENALGFASLRNKIEIEEEAWLNNEEPDWDNDPDDHFVVDEVTRTIFSENGQLMVAGELVDVSTLEELQEGSADSRSNGCKTGKSKSQNINYASGYRMRKRIAIRSYPWHTYVKARTISYKRKRGRWKRHRRRICAQAGGYVWEVDCTNKTYFNYPPEKCKKRKSVLWRQKLFRARTKKNQIGSVHKAPSYTSPVLLLTW